MNTSLSILWRSLTAQLIFSLVAVFAIKNTALMSDPQFVQIKVSLLFAVLAAALALVQRLSKQSPLFFLFGSRLGLPSRLWQRLTYALAAFYAVLAAANFVVAQLAPFSTWATFKTVVPLPALSIFIFAITPWLKRKEGKF